MKIEEGIVKIGKSTKESGTIIGESLKGIKVAMIKSLEASIKFYEEALKYTKHSKKKQQTIKKLNSNKESLAYLKAENAWDIFAEKTNEYLNLVSEFAKSGVNSQ